MPSESELDHTKLKKGFRGYDSKEVDQMLQTAAETLERVLGEKAALQETVDRQNQELESYRREERYVRDAIMAAQKSADEIRAGAHHEANSILAEARRAAESESGHSRKRAEDLELEIERLQFERKNFIDDFGLLLEKYQRELALVVEYGLEPSEDSPAV